MAFENPVFKMLAHNDTGGAPGHQGGVLIPKDLQAYFPPLVNQCTPENPTVSAFITADLYDGVTPLGSVQTRYQYQTWGATRSPERRITSNIGELRSRATKDDILLVEKQTGSALTYRLTLVRKGSPRHSAITRAAPGRRWGFLKQPIAA
jgi:putative restriction endonuclease